MTHARANRAVTHPFDPRCVCMACGEQIRKARAWESVLYSKHKKDEKEATR